MKNHLIKFYLGIAAILVFFSSCDLLDKSDEVKFDVKLPLEFVIDETGVSSIPKSYASAKLLKATDNADVAKYKDKIKDFKLTKITYVITECAPSGTVTFSNGSVILGTSGATIASVSAPKLLSDSPETELDSYDTDGFNTLATLLKNDKEAMVSLKGTFSTTPIKFKLTGYFYATITAEAF